MCTLTMDSKQVINNIHVGFNSVYVSLCDQLAIQGISP